MTRTHFGLLIAAALSLIPRHLISHNESFAFNQHLRETWNAYFSLQFCTSRHHTSNLKYFNCFRSENLIGVSLAFGTFPPVPSITLQKLPSNGSGRQLAVWGRVPAQLIDGQGSCKFYYNYSSRVLTVCSRRCLSAVFTDRGGSLSAHKSVHLCVSIKPQA